MHELLWLIWLIRWLNFKSAALALTMVAVTLMTGIKMNELENTLSLTPQSLNPSAFPSFYDHNLPQLELEIGFWIHFIVQSNQIFIRQKR